ncbi:MAG TPA: hypothetical protein PLN54_09675, partial [Flavobacteriales bacterium]|nr:hypothetical protein [Flavobacteriales bacterium]
MRSMTRPLFVLGSLLLALLSTAQVGLVVETKVYQRPGVGPYVDVNMALLGGTMVLKANERGFVQPKVEVLT